jgi:hypothetical protein
MAEGIYYFDHFPGAESIALPMFERAVARLLQVSHHVNSTPELQPLLDLILEQLRSVLDYSGASILLLEGTDLALDLALGSE